MIRQRMLALGLALVFAAGQALPWTLAAGAALWAGDTVAKPKSSGSGGYSRPSGGGGRTPSFGGFSGSSRTPSTSGGYGRPSSGFGGYAPNASGSAADRAMSRQSAKDALDAFRTPPSRKYETRRPSTGYNTGWDTPRRGDSGWTDGLADTLRRTQRWNPPPYVTRGPSRYGLLDAALLWFLLQTVSQPGHAEYFHHHADDPGYRQWRAEAEARAEEDPELRRNLQQLDQRLKRLEGQPRSSDYLPHDLATQRRASKQSSSQSSSGTGTFFLLLVVAVLVYLGWRAMSGDLAKRMQTVNNPGMKKSGASKGFYQPNQFRVGMSFPLDPSLFMLSAGITKITPPAGASGSGMISVEQVGRVEADDLLWHRLYLPGAGAFFQVHLDKSGSADECRYFSRIDEVAPGSQDEWGFWLDAQEGMIGWPEFQTKDGQVYGRLWSPGSQRVKPRRMTERLTELAGETSRAHQVMLYARPTGSAPPAPTHEYVLVAAVEAGDAAWVEIWAGIDVSVSLLQLS